MEFLTSTCTWILLGFVAVFTLWYLWKKMLSPVQYRFPSGPRTLPLLGCPWYVFGDITKNFLELAEKWGDCFTVQIPGEKIVALNTPEVARKAFRTEHGFSGRFPSPTPPSSLQYSTILMPPNEQWAKQRKLLHKILSMYGEGIEAAENVIHQELSHVIDSLEKRGDTAIDLKEIISLSVCNIMVIMLQGKRHEYGSKMLNDIRLVDDMTEVLFSPINAFLIEFFPFLKYWKIGPGKQSALNLRATERVLRGIYEETKATYEPGVTRGMVDHLIRHQQETRQEDGETWLEEKFMKSVIMEMLITGSITTGSALCAFFLIMLHKPSVAKTIQEEIDSVTGGHRLTKIRDRPDMPYTTAAILELLRYISHLPLGIPHQTTDDVRFEDYYLPKGVTLLANTWRFHHDEELWSEPWEFKPERFLDDEGKILPPEHPNRKNLQPFGVGRRSCVGETFARSRIFLFVTTLLQKYDFLPDPTTPPPSCDPRTYNVGVVVSPKQYYVRIKPRD